MKLYEIRSAQEEFKRRTKSRRQRLQGLVDLFQAGEIDVKRFRHSKRNTGSIPDPVVYRSNHNSNKD